MADTKHPDHHYTTRCTWEGSTAGGYEAYDRTHRASAPPADVELTLTSDPAFRGRPEHLDPEQLVVLAASSCQLLSFLAVAATARVDVVAYEDAAEGVMRGDERPMRITSIALHPEITVRGDVTDDRLAHLVEVAHRECFVANSLTTEITIEPTFIRTPD
jgi:organic hydroperoxide reductase OsmC/OhrA